jgi:circadian clock protein KaiC
MHLLTLNRLLEEINPLTVIIDPISSLTTIGNNHEVRAMLVRLMDTLKNKQINALFTSLTHQGPNELNDTTVDAVSSLADTWINLKNEDIKNERIRKLLIVKSRGMGHFNQQQIFNISSRGIRFLNFQKQ